MWKLPTSSISKMAGGFGRPGGLGYQTPFAPSPNRPLPRIPYSRVPLPDPFKQPGSSGASNAARFFTKFESPSSLRSHVASRAGSTYGGVDSRALGRELSKIMWQQRGQAVRQALGTGLRTIANVGSQIIPKIVTAVKNPWVWAAVAAVAIVAGTAYLVYKGVQAYYAQPDVPIPEEEIVSEDLTEAPTDGEPLDESLFAPRSVEEMWRYAKAREHSGIHYVHPRLRGVFPHR